MLILNKISKAFIALITIIILSTYAKSNNTLVSTNIKKGRDSLNIDKLIQSFDGFIAQKDKPNNQNQYIEKDYLLSTSALVDEIKGLEKNTINKDDNYYKCTLENIIKLQTDYYQIQFSYIGATENLVSLRALFTMFAKKTDGEFRFYSPLNFYTKSWLKKNLDGNEIIYKPEFDVSIAIDYFTNQKKFDAILGISNTPTKMYFADNFNESQKILGVDYKSDYNGVAYNMTTAFEKDSNLLIDGIIASEIIKFDPHDLWHSRMRKILPSRDIHKPVDEGCAFLFGGSWGYSWEDIVTRFKDYVKQNPNANWLEQYENPKNFGTEQYKDLRVDYMLNALIIKEYYNGKSFDNIMELLAIGNTQESKTKYFELLESKFGIKRSEFDNKIKQLIDKL